MAAVTATWVVATHPPISCGWGKGGRHALAVLFAAGADLVALLSLVLCWFLAVLADGSRGSGHTAAVWGTGLLAVALTGAAVAGVWPPFCG
jgi:hypothetical protein